MGASDRRENERHKIIWNVYRYLDDDFQYLGYLRDCSVTGFRFTTRLDLNIDEEFEVKITVPSELYSIFGEITLNFRAKIVHCKELDNKIHTKEYGTKFLDPSIKNKETVKKFISYWKNKNEDKI